MRQRIFVAEGNPFAAAEAAIIRASAITRWGHMSQSLNELSEIIEGIRSGDAGQADLVSRQHVMIQGERFNDLLAHMEQDI